MSAATPIILFPLYRWPGTSPAAFKEHYVKIHSEIGKRLGVVWYETFFNSAATPDWPVFGEPVADAITVMMFPSAEVLDNVRNTPIWLNEILPDCSGFVSHAPVYDVTRFTWIPENPKGGGGDGPLVVFPVYRWPGTTFDAFREHYIKVHSPIGMRIPGVTWYESFLNNNAHDEWPVFGAPVADAFALMRFESEAALANVADTPQWKEAELDDIGFASHALVVKSERITWVADPKTRQRYSR